MGTRRRQKPPPVAPFDVDGVRTVGIGTAVWALAFVVLLPFRAALQEAGQGWWLWTCLAGAGLGLLGLEVVRRRRDRIRAARRGRAPMPEAPLPADPPLALGNAAEVGADEASREQGAQPDQRP